MWLFILLQLAGVAATAALVVSNRIVLQEISMPCAAAVLVLAHNVGTMLFMRARGCVQEGRAKKVDCRWLLAINIVGSFAVLMSNVVLQRSSVTFHQLARLTAIPAGAAVDFVLDGKRCSPLQLVGLVILCLGVLKAANGEVSGVNGATCAAAAAMVAGTLAVAVLTRIACKRAKVTSAEFMYHSTPWSVLTASIQLAACAGLYAWPLHGGFFAGHLFAVRPRTELLLTNLLLALLVQYLSTWAAANTSTTMYAVLGQASGRLAIIAVVSMVVYVHRRMEDATQVSLVTRDSD